MKDGYQSGEGGVWYGFTAEGILVEGIHLEELP